MALEISLPIYLRGAIELCAITLGYAINGRIPAIELATEEHTRGLAPYESGGSAFGNAVTASATAGVETDLLNFGLFLIS